MTNSARQTAWATHCFQMRPKSAARNVTSARRNPSPKPLFSNVSSFKASYLSSLSFPPASSFSHYYHYEKNSNSNQRMSAFSIEQIIPPSESSSSRRQFIFKIDIVASSKQSRSAGLFSGEVRVCNYSSDKHAKCTRTRYAGAFGQLLASSHGVIKLHWGNGQAEIFPNVL